MFEAVLSLDAAHADTLCAYGDLLSRVKVLCLPPSHLAPLPLLPTLFLLLRLELSARAPLTRKVQGDVAAAEHHYQRALRADANHVDALCSYALLLSQFPARKSEAAGYLKRVSVVCMTL